MNFQSYEAYGDGTALQTKSPKRRRINPARELQAPAQGQFIPMKHKPNPCCARCRGRGGYYVEVNPIDSRYIECSCCHEPPSDFSLLKTTLLILIALAITVGFIIWCAKSQDAELLGKDIFGVTCLPVGHNLQKHDTTGDQGPNLNHTVHSVCSVGVHGYRRPSALTGCCPTVSQQVVRQLR